MTRNIQSEVVIAIPAFREQLVGTELISFKRCAAIFAGYPRVLFVPRTLDIAAYQAVDPGIQAERFDPKYFVSKMAYSVLCCRPEFYARFLAYRFMLIYQLDSYVFEDQLMYWCRQGYDYVGAPWPKYEHIGEGSRFLLKLPFMKSFFRRAGQGGFSLRKVDTLHQAARWLSWFRFLTHKYTEDVLWAALGSRFHRPFRIAGFEESLPFAFDSNAELCYNLNGGKLPFGCHRWFGRDADFWKEKAKSYEMFPA